MYVNKCVELVQRGIALHKNLCIIIIINARDGVWHVELDAM